MEQGVKDFADKVKGWIDGVRDSLNGISDWFKEHSDILISSLVAIGAVFAVIFGPGAVAGIATWGASLFRWLVAIIPEAWAAATAFIAMNAPIIAIIAVVALLAFGISMLIIHWKEVKEWAKNVWDGIVAIWGKVAEWFKTEVTEPFVKGWNRAWTDFATGVSRAWTTLTDAFKDAGTWFMNNVWTPIVNWFIQLGTDIGTHASTAWTNVTNAFSAAGTWFKESVIDKIVEKWQTFKTDVKTVASEAWTNITSAFTTAGSWFMDNVVTPIKTALGKITEGVGSGLVTAFSFVYNRVAGYLNDLIGKWNGIVGSNPLTSGLKMGFSVPYLAKGGITSGPMMAVIGDNPGGQEVVAPLDRLTGLVATAVTQSMAFAQPQRSSAPQGDIVLNIDGRTFARIAKPYLDGENARTGNVMLTTI
jgi:hypothetical protein